jgi:hypothetical protein
MSQDIDAGARRRRHGRQAGAAAATVMTIALLAAACGGGSGGPGVASAGTTATTSGKSGSPGSGGANALKFSQCMRAHGLSDFPDPNAQGLISISVAAGSELTPNSPQWQAAMKACQQYTPAGSLTPSQKAQLDQDALKYSHCMQTHGVADFPDPNSQGQTQISAGSSSDLDPNSPQFQKAQTDCAADQPGKIGGGFGIQIKVHATAPGPGGGAPGGNGSASSGFGIAP